MSLGLTLQTAQVDLSLPPIRDQTGHVRTVPYTQLLVRTTLRRLRLLGWSYVVAGLSAGGLVLAVVLGMLTPVLLLPGGPTLRRAVGRLVEAFADLHRWTIGSTLHDERPYGYGSVPFDPRGLLRVSLPAGATSLRRDVPWLVVCAPAGLLTAVLVGVLPIAFLNGVSLPLQYALVGQHPSGTPMLVPVNGQAASLVAMVVGVVGLTLWWWGAPRIMRGYALLSRRMLGFAATTAVTARVRHLLSARAAAPKRSDTLARLTPREREVLGLVAEGRTNAAIANRLFITEKAVDKHLTSVFRKLELAASAEDNRRVLAALAYLRE